MGVEDPWFPFSTSVVTISVIIVVVIVGIGKGKGKGKEEEEVSFHLPVADGEVVSTILGGEGVVCVFCSGS